MRWQIHMEKNGRDESAVPSPAECPICFEFFEADLGGVHFTVSLNCGHSFCHECAQGFGEDAGWKCPVCRGITRCNELRPNFSLIEQLDALKQFSPKQAPGCEEWKEDGKLSLATTYCEDCKTCLCQDCMDQLHQAKTLQRHKRRLREGP